MKFHKKLTDCWQFWMSSLYYCLSNLSRTWSFSKSAAYGHPKPLMYSLFLTINISNLKKYWRGKIQLPLSRIPSLTVPHTVVEVVSYNHLSSHPTRERAKKFEFFNLNNYFKSNLKSHRQQYTCKDEGRLFG